MAYVMLNRMREMDDGCWDFEWNGNTRTMGGGECL